MSTTGFQSVRRRSVDIFTNPFRRVPASWLLLLNLYHCLFLFFGSQIEFYRGIFLPEWINDLWDKHIPRELISVPQKWKFFFLDDDRSLITSTEIYFFGYNIVFQVLVHVYALLGIVFSLWCLSHQLVLTYYGQQRWSKAKKDNLLDPPRSTNINIGETETNLNNVASDDEHGDPRFRSPVNRRSGDHFALNEREIGDFYLGLNEDRLNQHLIDSIISSNINTTSNNITSPPGMMSVGTTLGPSGPLGSSANTIGLDQLRYLVNANIDYRSTSLKGMLWRGASITDYRKLESQKDTSEIHEDYDKTSNEDEPFYQADSEQELEGLVINRNNSESIGSLVDVKNLSGTDSLVDFKTQNGIITKGAQNKASMQTSGERNKMNGRSSNVDTITPLIFLCSYLSYRWFFALQRYMFRGFYLFLFITTLGSCVWTLYYFREWQSQDASKFLVKVYAEANEKGWSKVKYIDYENLLLSRRATDYAYGLDRTPSMLFFPFGIVNSRDYHAALLIFLSNLFVHVFLPLSILVECSRRHRRMCEVPVFGLSVGRIGGEFKRLRRATTYGGKISSNKSFSTPRITLSRRLGASLVRYYSVHGWRTRGIFPSTLRDRCLVFIFRNCLIASEERALVRGTEMYQMSCTLCCCGRKCSWDCCKRNTKWIFCCGGYVHKCLSVLGYHCKGCLNWCKKKLGREVNLRNSVNGQELDRVMGGSLGNENDTIGQQQRLTPSDDAGDTIDRIVRNDDLTNRNSAAVIAGRSPTNFIRNPDMDSSPLGNHLFNIPNPLANGPLNDYSTDELLKRVDTHQKRRCRWVTGFLVYIVAAVIWYCAAKIALYPLSFSRARFTVEHVAFLLFSRSDPRSRERNLQYPGVGASMMEAATPYPSQTDPTSMIEKQEERGPEAIPTEQEKDKPAGSMIEKEKTAVTEKEEKKAYALYTDTIGKYNAESALNGSNGSGSAKYSGIENSKLSFEASLSEVARRYIEKTVVPGRDTARAVKDVGCRRYTENLPSENLVCEFRGADDQYDDYGERSADESSPHLKPKTVVYVFFHGNGQSLNTAYNNVRTVFESTFNTDYTPAGRKCLRRQEKARDQKNSSERGGDSPGDELLGAGGEMSPGVSESVYDKILSEVCQKQLWRMKAYLYAYPGYPGNFIETDAVFSGRQPYTQIAQFLRIILHQNGVTLKNSGDVGEDQFVLAELNGEEAYQSTQTQTAFISGWIDTKPTSIPDRVIVHGVSLGSCMGPSGVWEYIREEKMKNMNSEIESEKKRSISDKMLGQKFSVILEAPFSSATEIMMRYIYYAGAPWWPFFPWYENTLGHTVDLGKWLMKTTVTDSEAVKGTAVKKIEDIRKTTKDDWENRLPPKENEESHLPSNRQLYGEEDGKSANGELDSKPIENSKPVETIFGETPSERERPLEKQSILEKKGQREGRSFAQKSVSKVPIRVVEKEFDDIVYPDMASRIASAIETRLNVPSPLILHHGAFHNNFLASEGNYDQSDPDFQKFKKFVLMEEGEL